MCEFHGSNFPIGSNRMHFLWKCHVFDRIWMHVTNTFSASSYPPLKLFLDCLFLCFDRLWKEELSVYVEVQAQIDSLQLQNGAFLLQCCFYNTTSSTGHWRNRGLGRRIWDHTATCLRDYIYHAVCINLGPWDQGFGQVPVGGSLNRFFALWTAVLGPFDVIAGKVSTIAAVGVICCTLAVLFLI